MINQGNNIPDKTIAIFTDPFESSLGSKEKNRLFNMLNKSPKKREWFSPHFYRCLPLVIGNQYGFIIKNEFDFAFTWNGSNDTNGLTFDFFEKIEDINKKYCRIDSHFGHGIITINPPFFLKTPPGVNLMTINPPNYVIPNITVMTGVVEADNIRRNFTFNLKVQIPNIRVVVPAGTPLAAFIPIPRYYADSFELKLAEDVLGQEAIDEELQASYDANIHRQVVEPTLQNEVGRHYFKGQDVYENKFLDHQKP
jgi:hypothetical protein